VIDEFLRQYGQVPVYGALARARRTELAKQATAPVRPQPQAGPQVAMADTPVWRRDGVPLTAAQERALKPKDTFRECKECPDMVVVPAGSFTMGSPEGEKDRGPFDGPQHTVTIGRPFAVGKLHVTIDQFAAFVRETGYEASPKCYTYEGRDYLEERRGRWWRDPGYSQEGSHPVVCVSWDDANGYAIGWR